MWSSTVRTARQDGRTPEQPEAEPIEATYRVTPAEIEQAVSRTAQQYAGDMATVFDRVSALYEAQLVAKDETIAELRRRAEAAEAEASTLRAQRAPHEAPAASEVCHTRRRSSTRQRACGQSCGGGGAGWTANSAHSGSPFWCCGGGC
jgi:hypothetical protein